MWSGDDVMPCLLNPSNPKIKIIVGKSAKTGLMKDHHYTSPLFKESAISVEPFRAAHFLIALPLVGLVMQRPHAALHPL